MHILGLIAFVLVSQLLPGSAARKKGRDGNTQYETSQYEEATETYSEGMQTYDDGREPDAAYYGLQNNLGAALYRQQNFDGAGEAFARAASHAPQQVDRIRSTYNAGNAAFQRQDQDAALKHYRDVLLADPGNEDARFNYEFVLRQQEQEQQQEQEPDQEQEEQDQEQDQEEQEEQEEPPEQDNQEQQQERQDSERQEQQEQQPGESDTNGQELTPEQAERILQALENDEQQLLREIRRVETPRRRVAKDW